MGRSSTWGRFAATLGASALIALAVAGPVTAADGDGESSGEETVELDNAQLRWGINNESNNAAHNPGTFNFLSAGKVDNPGEGAQVLSSNNSGATWRNGKSAGWANSKSNVEIEKWDGSKYQAATWDGLKTDSDGQTIPGPTSGDYSNHQFVFSKGKGKASADGRTAHIEWEGDVTVLYYSGMSFFYLSDPELTVTDGKGSLTATASGFASSMIDPTVWEEVAPEKVTIADLPDISITEGGFSVSPKYKGVKADQKDCITSGEVWGSFPQSYMKFMEKVGTHPYWCSSGLSTDRAKVPTPVTVSFDADSPVDTPAPGKDPTPNPTPTNSTPDPTPTTPSPTTTAGTGGKRTTSEAVLRWGMNNESNNRAWAAGTFNFFSAGKVANPGEGAQYLTSSGTKWKNGKSAGWKKGYGNVSLQKWNGSKYEAATWDGLTTDSDGESIPSANSGKYSNHQFVFSKGKGTADLDRGTAKVSWVGDVSVLYYSGMSFFYLSNPELTVSGGKGTLRATMSGYGSSRDDASKWEALKPRTVTIADLRNVSFQDDRFTVTPEFKGVRVSQSGCNKSVDDWGSFPQSYLDFVEDVGLGPYWCTSGGTSDRAKTPLPVTVSLDSSALTETDAPDDDDSSSDSDDIDNEAIAAPSFTSTLADGLASVPGAIAGVGSAVASAASFPVRLVSSTLGTGAPTLWIVGSLLWVLTAAAVTETLRRFPTPTNRSTNEDLS